MPRVPRGFNDQAARTGETVAGVIRRHVVPVFQVNDTNEPEFEGSGVLLRVADRFFLVSAAHVFDSLRTGVHLLIEGSEESPLQQPVHLTGGKLRHLDMIDLGYVELTPTEINGLGSQNFLYLEQTRNLRNTPRRWFDHYLVLGFQVSRQKKDHLGKVYQTNQTYYTAPEISAPEYKSAGLELGRNIGLEFNHRKIAGPRSRRSAELVGYEWRRNLEI